MSIDLIKMMVESMPDKIEQLGLYLQIFAPKKEDLKIQLGFNRITERKAK